MTARRLKLQAVGQSRIHHAAEAAGQRVTNSVTTALHGGIRPCTSADRTPQLASRIRKQEHQTTFPDTEEVTGSNPVGPPRRITTQATCRRAEGSCSRRPPPLACPIETKCPLRRALNRGPCSSPSTSRLRPSAIARSRPHKKVNCLGESAITISTTFRMLCLEFAADLELAISPIRMLANGSACSTAARNRDLALATGNYDRAPA